MKTKGQRTQTHNKSKRRKQVRACDWIFGAMLAVVAVVLIVCITSCKDSSAHTEPVESENTYTPTVSTETTEIVQEPTSLAEESAEPTIIASDPNNGIYPYSMVRDDLVAEAYEQGWRYYEIPTSYKMAGGMFPEVAQVYLWSVCKEAGVDYYMVLAMIERESGYRYYATGDNGKSKGLLQVQERWHKDRMRVVGATDLYNPYDNIRVAVNFLKEIQDTYLSSSGEHCVLMVYNMGASGARKLWDKGIYSTDYTKQILKRAQEIKQELQEN